MDIDDVRVAGQDIRFRFRRIETEQFSSEEVFGSQMLDINTQEREYFRTRCMRVDLAKSIGAILEES